MLELWLFICVVMSYMYNLSRYMWVLNLEFSVRLS